MMRGKTVNNRDWGDRATRFPILCLWWCGSSVNICHIMTKQLCQMCQDSNWLWDFSQFSSARSICSLQYHCAAMNLNFMWRVWCIIFSKYQCQNWITLILICRFQYHYGHLLWPVTLSDINIELLIAICPRCCNTLMLLTDPLWVVSRRGAAAMNSTWFQFWLIKEFIRKKVDKEVFITSFEFHTCWTFFLEMFELTFRHLVAETQKITSLKVTSFHNFNPLL